MIEMKKWDQKCHSVTKETLGLSKNNLDLAYYNNRNGVTLQTKYDIIWN